MLHFGDFIYDAEQQRLLLNKGDNKAYLDKSQLQEVEIEPKLLELLAFFIRKPNTIISRQALLDEVWANTYVTDNAINKLVGNLRKALNDDAKTPRYIQTIPKRGYRFICEIIPIANLPEQTAISNENELEQQTNLFLSKSGLIILFGMLFLSSALWWFLENLKTANLKVESAGYSVALTRDQGFEFSPVMHPDNTHLFYLKETNTDTGSETALWIKHTQTADANKIVLDTEIKDIIAVYELDNQTSLMYLDKAQGRCDVYRVNVHLATQINTLKEPVALNSEHLFTCTDKRVKDIEFHAQSQTIYYTAQPENFWPNHIYAFDIANRQHKLLNQPTPKGWGHHHIDVSPDGEKLLIMSTQSDHKTQLLSYNLANNQVEQGMKFDRPAYEAIWHHDSKRIFYYASSPSQKIISSELNGSDVKSVVNISEPLAKQLSRVNDGKSLLFSTEQDNFNLRLLSKNVPLAINNSTVLETHPALFHHSEQYLFASNRSGIMQLYLADAVSGQTKIVSNFSRSYSLSALAMSANDEHVLLAIENKVYVLPLKILQSAEPITVLSQAKLLFSSQDPIISLDWFGLDKVAITAVSNAKPVLHIKNLNAESISLPKGEWAYGLFDPLYLNKGYLLERHSNLLYPIQWQNERHGLEALTEKPILALPHAFYWAKIDNGALYFVTTENNQEFLNRISFNAEQALTKFKLNTFASFDVSKDRVMVSDLAKREGDIHLTVSF
jgi:DNA-binding winged helix-turn-helix (wHTH) protein